MTTLEQHLTSIICTECTCSITTQKQLVGRARVGVINSFMQMWKWMSCIHTKLKKKPFTLRSKVSSCLVCTRKWKRWILLPGTNHTICVRDATLMRLMQHKYNRVLLGPYKTNVAVPAAGRSKLHNIIKVFAGTRMVFMSRRKRWQNKFIYPVGRNLISLAYLHIPQNDYSW